MLHSDKFKDREVKGVYFDKDGNSTAIVSDIVFNALKAFGVKRIEDDSSIIVSEIPPSQNKGKPEKIEVKKDK